MNAEEYPNALRPLTVRGVTLPNRIVRSAHGTGMDIGPDLIAYHSAAARGGVGLTVLDTAGVHPTGPGAINTHVAAVMDAYARVVESLRAHPMRLFQQLSHPGRSINRPDGLPPWSASDVAGPRLAAVDPSTVPHPMTAGEIDGIVEAFARGARRVVDAGVDGVEIHAAHGDLLGQFLSPLTNVREDEFGGTPENRRRLVVRILEAVRSELGPEVPVGVRLSADEMVPGGLGLVEVTEVAAALDKEGVIDFLDLSLGSPLNFATVIGGMDEPLGYELPYSVPVGRAVSVPTIVGGRVTSLAQAEAILAAGDASLVSMVRAHLADPDLIAKSVSGQAHRVRPCIGCNQGCVGFKSSPGMRFGCTVNPAAGRERIELTSRPEPRRVLVVGGGPAGMEAARTAAVLGDEVVLCERRDTLGGQLDLARRAPHRGAMGEIVDWLAGELDALGVTVRLGAAVTAADVLAERFDRVIVATGSRPRMDGFQIADPLRPVPGIDLPHVHSSWDVLGGVEIDPGTVVVYDDLGHQEGVSVAEYLLDRGHRVVLASRLNRLVPLLEWTRAETTVKKRVLPRAFTFLGDCLLGEITPTTVTITSLYGAPETVVEASAVVVAGANRPHRGLADELAGAVDVDVVGDAVGPRYLHVAMAEAHRSGQGER